MNYSKIAIFPFSCSVIHKIKIKITMSNFLTASLFSGFADNIFVTKTHLKTFFNHLSSYREFKKQNFINDGEYFQVRIPYSKLTYFFISSIIHLFSYFSITGLKTCSEKD